jgi:hypothetical protein
VLVPAGMQVYERRPEPRNDAVDTGRAYIIIVIPRGQAALKEVSGSWQHITWPHSRSTLQGLLRTCANILACVRLHRPPEQESTVNHRTPSAVSTMSQGMLALPGDCNASWSGAPCT